MPTPRLLALAASLTLALAAAGCGDDSASSSSATAPAPGTTPTAASTGTGGDATCAATPPASSGARPTFDAPPPMSIEATATYTATMRTSCGTITIALDAKAAPNTVNSFVFLARNKFFDGLTFHRIIQGFVIQGGDPEGNGRGGPGYEFADELPATAYRIGDLAMANAGPNTNGSQFFIITGDQGAALDRAYSRFGRVTAGMDAVQRIEALADPASADGVPVQPVYIETVTVAETR